MRALSPLIFEELSLTETARSLDLSVPSVKRELDALWDELLELADRPPE